MVTLSDATKFYVDEAGEHRWRSQAKNGRIIGAASEGFSSEDKARKNAGLLGIALTVETREKLGLLCRLLEDMGYKLIWHKAREAVGVEPAIAAYWEVRAPTEPAE